MSQTILHFRAASAPSPRPGWRAALARLWSELAEARGRAQTRRQIATLDDRGLSDIGLSAAQAQFVTERPVWELMPFLHR